MNISRISLILLNINKFNYYEIINPDKKNFASHPFL